MPKEFSSTKRIHSQERKRDSIWSAFLILLEDIPLEKISVQDICDKALIHRTTFYNHFYDVYDLISFGTQKLTASLVPADISDFTDERVSENLSNFIIKYRKILLNLQKTSFVKDLLDSTDVIFESRIFNTIKNSKDVNTLNFPPELMAKFIRAGLKEMLFVWLESPYLENDEIKAQVDEVIGVIKKICIK